jgi:hypothetical protein
MEFLKLTYPTSRSVFIDGELCGRTNEVLNVEAGTHLFDLGRLTNYTPDNQKMSVAGTTALNPMVIVFQKKGL